MYFKLAELRKKNNLTQQELGDVLSVSYQTISKWENGVVSPDISMLPKISQYFGISVDALLGLVPLGQVLMPLLPDGSRYVGIDFSEKMIEAAKECHRNVSYETEFILKDILEYRPIL